MTGDAEIDEVTGLNVAEMESVAEVLYAQRDELGGDEVEVEYPAEVRSVVSVRLRRAELDVIAAAATAAGQPVSTYIRNVALAAAGAVDIEAARREWRAAARALDQLGRKLGSAA